MSSSECGEDEMERLKDALDPSLVANDLYKRSVSIQETNKITKNTTLKSLRPSNDAETISSPFGITPEAQKFIASRLSKLLDAQLDEKLVENVKIVDKPRRKSRRRSCDTDKGVVNDSSDTVLFTNSSFFLHEPEDEIVERKINQKRYKFKQKIIDMDQSDEYGSEMDKCRAVAVSPEYVLAKQETRHWAKRRRKYPIQYKLVNGVLELVEKNEWTSQ